MNPGCSTVGKIHRGVCLKKKKSDARHCFIFLGDIKSAFNLHYCGRWYFSSPCFLGLQKEHVSARTALVATCEWLRRSLPWAGAEGPCKGRPSRVLVAHVGRAWAGAGPAQKIGADPRDNDFSGGHRGAAGGHKALHQHSWIHSEHLSVLLDSTLLLILGALFAFVRLFW